MEIKASRREEIKYIYDSIKGKNKQENQDNVLISIKDSYSLFIVFDGVGSSKNSKKATEFSIDFIIKNSDKFLQNNISLNILMYETHKHLIDLEIEGLLTTYCAMVIKTNRRDKVIYSSLGDTRLYISHPQYIEQITKDDRLPFIKNIITKCLGLSDLSKDDFNQYEIELSEDNINILICTDGFYHFMEKDLLAFFETINNQTFKSIKKYFYSIIDKNNDDDSTYLLVR